MSIYICTNQLNFIILIQYEQIAIRYPRLNTNRATRQDKQFPIYFVKQRQREYSKAVVQSLTSSSYLDPFDKLIASDQLSYLPNLYLRQYKAIDQLVRLRQEFPQQRVILSRPYTKWDGLLDQMRLRAKVVQEEKKFKIVQRSQNVKYIKLEVQRNQLRNEQNYQYHRLVSSYLSSSVIDLYHQCKSVVEQPKKEIKQEEQKTIVKKNQDDIFVERGDDYYDVPQENNLLDDLLNDPIVQKKEEYIEREEIYIEPISSYLSISYVENKDEIINQPKVSISRKTSLKRINQNVRKRLKIKQQEEDQPGRSLSSATVSLSNLLTSQPESKSQILIELPSKTQWLFTSDKARKRKEEDTFELRWGTQQLQKFQQRNQKFNIKKGKIDNNILVMNLTNDEEQYKKYFQKNIQADKSFPPTLQNIPKLDIQKTKKYYNQFHDIEYQKFIRKYNKKRIFKQFSLKAPYLFPQNYSVDEMDDNQSVNAGKIFVHPPEKVLNKIIYKITDYKFSASVKNDFSHIEMDLNEMILLTFFVKKYIKNFGNDWKSITKFIEMNPIFSNHHITQQIVQQVYQLITKFEDNDKISQINLWDKKILPFDYYGCYSYAQFDQKLYQKGGATNVQKMDVQSLDTDQSSQPFDFDRYQEMIEQDPQEPSLNELQALEKEYRAFGLPIFQNIYYSQHNFATDREDKFYKIKSVLQKFEESSKEIRYVPDERDKKQSLGKILDDVMNLSKGSQPKTACPFRKKKNINERNNELVKILQALRNKTANQPPTNAPKKPDQIGKSYPPSSNPAKNVPPATVNAPPAPVPKPNEPAVDQKKNIQKSPEKSDKKLGAPPKKDRKNKDEQKK